MHRAQPGAGTEISHKICLHKGESTLAELENAEKVLEYEERRKTSPTPPQRERQCLKGSQGRGFKKGTHRSQHLLKADLQQQSPKGRHSSLCLRAVVLTRTREGGLMLTSPHIV